jgi:hypothetical protein
MIDLWGIGIDEPEPPPESDVADVIPNAPDPSERPPPGG